MRQIALGLLANHCEAIRQPGLNHPHLFHLAGGAELAADFHQLPRSLRGGDAQLLQRSRQWFDIVHLAFQTDSTRVISLWLGSQERPEIEGVTLAHHDASHHGQEPTKLEQLALIEEAELKVLGEFLDKLKGSTENEQTLLDRTAIFYASNLGNSSSHDTHNMPIVLAGGPFKHGQCLAFDEKRNKPLANIYVSMLQAPMTVLACNVSDRADITAVAILGYN